MLDGIESRVAADLVAWATARLAPVSDCARLEAELLLAASAGLERAAIMAQPERSISASELARLAEDVERRSRGEPLAYIFGRREFYSLGLSVDPAVLVPRAETETLVDLVLQQHIPPEGAVLDLGTGSGAIALALKSARNDLVVVGSDCSRGALAVARRNSAALGLAIEWRESDWFAALRGFRFHAIVSNPPYVPSGDRHFDSQISHEPRLALDGGEDGLDAYRAILAVASQHLHPGGQIALEHGYDQRRNLLALAAGHGYVCAAQADDLAGRPRALVLARADEH
jgi:release factor glutamine methyltransferase